MLPPPTILRVDPLSNTNVGEPSLPRTTRPDRGARTEIREPVSARRERHDTWGHERGPTATRERIERVRRH